MWKTHKNYRFPQVQNVLLVSTYASYLKDAIGKKKKIFYLDDDQGRQSKRTTKMRKNIYIRLPPIQTLLRLLLFSLFVLLRMLSTVGSQVISFGQPRVEGRGTAYRFGDALRMNQRIFWLQRFRSIFFSSTKNHHKIWVSRPKFCEDFSSTKKKLSKIWYPTAFCLLIGFRWNHKGSRALIFIGYFLAPAKSSTWWPQIVKWWKTKATDNDSGRL